MTEKKEKITLSNREAQRRYRMNNYEASKKLIMKHYKNNKEEWKYFSLKSRTRAFVNEVASLGDLQVLKSDLLDRKKELKND